MLKIMGTKSYYFGTAGTGEDVTKKVIDEMHDRIQAELRKLGVEGIRFGPVLTQLTPTRMMSMSDLSDKLKKLGELGVNVPILRHSNYKPDYLGTSDDGVQFYMHAGTIIEVGQGMVIDDNGNEVPLSNLEARATELRTGKKDAGNYSDILMKYLSPQKDNNPKDERLPAIMALYQYPDKNK
jgi:hypothetical protein